MLNRERLDDVSKTIVDTCTKELAPYGLKISGWIYPVGKSIRYINTNDFPSANYKTAVKKLLELGWHKRKAEDGGKGMISLGKTVGNPYED